MQHALGVAYAGGRLYVADTYNHKIKIIDPVARTSQTWIGNGQIGWQDGAAGQAELAEPSGLSVAGDKLYIADTNNHLIRVADLATGEVSTLVGTAQGQVVIRCDKRIPPDTKVKLEQVREQLSGDVLERKVQQEMQVAFNELKAKAKPQLILRPTLQVEDLAASTKELMSGLPPVGAGGK